MKFLEKVKLIGLKSQKRFYVKKFPNYAEPQPIKSKQKIWQYMLSHGFYSEEFSDFIGNGIEG